VTLLALGLLSIRRREARRSRAAPPVDRKYQAQP